MSQEKSFEIRSTHVFPKPVDQSSSCHSDQAPHRKKNHDHRVKHHRVLPIIDENYTDS
jgi:hypothetical protein